MTTTSISPDSTTHSLKTNEGVVLEKIKELEQQKDELFREINKAMEESISALKNSNVSNAERGVIYIEDLKRQIKNIADTDNNHEDDHDADSGIDSTPFTYDEKNSINADTRRKNDKRSNHLKIGKKKNNYGGQVMRQKTRTPPAYLNDILLNVTEIQWRPKSNHKRGDQKFIENAMREIDRFVK